MVFNRGFELLLLNPDIPLCYRGAAVLLELLHQGDVIAVGLVDLGGEELPKAVGADPLVPKEITDQLACKTTKDKAAAFKMACESVSTKENPCNPNAVLIKAINDFMNREDIGGWDLWLEKVAENK